MKIFFAVALLTGCATASHGEFTARWANPGEVTAVALPNGFTLRTVTTGSGPPLILMHTLRTQVDYFEAIIRPLAAQYRVYAVDLPGHGQSTILPVEYTEPMMRGAISELITKLDLHDVTLVGESIGGVLALTVAAERSDRISRVVSINPYDYGDTFGGGIRNGNASWVIGLFHAFGGVETKGLFTDVLESGFYDPSRLPPDFADEAYRTGLREGYRQMEYSLFENWQTWVKAKMAYPKVTSPTTLVYAERDWSRQQDRDETKRLIRGVHVVTIEKAGHFVSLERPDAVVRAVLERP